MIHHGKWNRYNQTNQSYKSDEQLISPCHNTAQSIIKVLREAKMIIKEKELDSVGCLKYCQTPLYRHPLNTDNALLQTVFFVPEGRKP